MNALELGGVILASEFALVAWGVLLLILKRHHRAAAQDHADANAMMETVETGETSRRAALEDLFKTNLGFQDEALEAEVNGYLEREKAFYHVMTRIYLARDGEKLHDLPKELTKVMGPLAQSLSDKSADKSARENLEYATAELAGELAQTRKTLSQLIKEYEATMGRSPSGFQVPATTALSADPAKTPEVESSGLAIEEGSDPKPVAIEPEEPEAFIFDLADEFEISEGKVRSRVR